MGTSELTKMLGVTALEYHFVKKGSRMLLVSKLCSFRQLYHWPTGLSIIIAAQNCRGTAKLDSITTAHGRRWVKTHVDTVLHTTPWAALSNTDTTGSGEAVTFSKLHSMFSCENQTNMSSVITITFTSYGYSLASQTEQWRWMNSTCTSVYVICI